MSWCRHSRHAPRMPRYRRLWVPGGTYFFTVNLLERRRSLLVEQVDILRDAFRRAHAERPFDMPAWVILPDHLHCIWRLPKNRGQSRLSMRSDGGIL